MSGRLPVGRTTAPYIDEHSRVRQNDSIRQIAKAAFAPFSEIAVGTNATQSFSTGAWVAITGISQNIVVSIPSSLRSHATVRVECTTYAAGETFFLALHRDGTIVAETIQAWQPAAVNEATSLSFSWLHSDLHPGNTYTYDLRVRIFTNGTAAYEVNGTRSNLLLTTEARPRV